MVDLREIEGWLERHANYGGAPVTSPKRDELEPIQTMLAAAGSPQASYPVVQVAGTRGKGTTTHFIAQLLSLRGFKVGLFTSPHLIRLTERIMVAGKEITPVVLMERLVEARQLRLSGQAGFFDLLTTAAALHFRAEQVDVAVFEAGKGGESDSTTALGADLFLLTNVGADHLARLGKCNLERTRTKAAALSHGAVFVSGLPFGSPEWALAQGIARDRGALICGLGREFFFRGLEWGPGERLVEVDLRASAMGQRLEKVRVRNHARFFDLNAALAQVAVMVMGERVTGLAAGAQPLPEPALLEPLPGRFQLARMDPPLVLDGAQSPEAFSALLADWKTLFGPSVAPEVLLALGQERQAGEIMVALKKGGAGLVRPLQVDVQRGLKPDEMVELAREHGLAAEAMTGGPDALHRYLQQTTKPCLVTGSLYLVGEVLARGS